MIHIVLYSMHSAPKMWQKSHSPISLTFDRKQFCKQSFQVIHIIYCQFSIALLLHTKNSSSFLPTTFSFVHHSVLRLVSSKTEHQITKIVKEINSYSGFSQPVLSVVIIFVSPSPFTNATQEHCHAIHFHKQLL